MSKDKKKEELDWVYTHEEHKEPPASNTVRTYKKASSYDVRKQLLKALNGKPSILSQKSAVDNEFKKLVTNEDCDDSKIDDVIKSHEDGMM